jgi:hypothetical protein
MRVILLFLSDSLLLIYNTLSAQRAFDLGGNRKSGIGNITPAMLQSPFCFMGEDLFYGSIGHCRERLIYPAQPGNQHDVVPDHGQH